MESSSSYSSSGVNSNASSSSRSTTVTLEPSAKDSPSTTTFPSTTMPVVILIVYILPPHQHQLPCLVAPVRTVNPTAGKPRRVQSLPQRLRRNVRPVRAELDCSRRPPQATLRAPARQNALVSPTIAPRLSENVLSGHGRELSTIISGDTLFDLSAPCGFDVGKRSPL